jgi:hypothetical protein
MATRIEFIWFDALHSTATMMMMKVLMKNSCATNQNQGTYSKRLVSRVISKQGIVTRVILNYGER